MKIHDKYIIELAEIIKGYGNDPTVKDPLNLPCDYKFYEIEGVAICEDSFKKMEPLYDFTWSLVDDIFSEVWGYEEPTGSEDYVKGWIEATTRAENIIKTYYPKRDPDPGQQN